MSDKNPPTLPGELAAGIRQALGTIPEDLLGLAGGDWLREKREQNRDRLKRRTKEILKSRGVTPDQETAAPLLLEEISKAAEYEQRPEIQEIWARLLAAAIDKTRAKR